MKLEITAIGDAVYLKGDQKTWEMFGVPAAAGRALANKWVKVPPGQVTNLSGFSLDDLAAQLAEADNPLEPGVEQTTLDGNKVVVISQQDGSKLYVANTGPAYPLRGEMKGANAGRIDLTEYGADPRHARIWMARRGFLFCRKGEVREIMRPIPLPGESVRWGLCDGIHRDDHEFVPA